jgi:hypothetical protein
VENGESGHEICNHTFFFFVYTTTVTFGDNLVEIWTIKFRATNHGDLPLPISDRAEVAGSESVRTKMAKVADAGCGCTKLGGGVLDLRAAVL